MRARHVMVIGAALVALAGCSSAGAAEQSAGAPAAASAAAATPSAAPAESVDPGTDPGTLDATSAYLTALGKLDKKLVGDTRAALDHGQAVCIDIAERRTGAEQEKNIAARFAVDAAQAKRILVLTKANLCLE
jgi:glucose/arabinose dehydrogenase